MSRLRLRPAGEGDLDDIVRIFLDCFRHTYASRLPSRVSEAFDDAEARALWASALAHPARRVGVAADHSPDQGQGQGQDQETVRGVIGFEAVEATGWIHSLYVAPEAQNTGVGTVMLDRAVQDLADAGCTEILLWVFAANTPSLRFYEANGWKPDGVERVEERFGEKEIRLSRAMGSTS